MAVKTITIDMEAYTRVKTAKRSTESFSDTIKRIVPAPFDFDAFVRKLDKNSLGDEFANVMEEVVARRRRPAPRRGHGQS